MKRLAFLAFAALTAAAPASATAPTTVASAGCTYYWDWCRPGMGCSLERLPDGNVLIDCDPLYSTPEIKEGQR